MILSLLTKIHVSFLLWFGNDHVFLEEQTLNILIKFTLPR